MTCQYLTGQDKILFCDGYGIGIRSDYNGVLLLDTILQKPVSCSKDVVQLELLLSEVGQYGNGAVTLPTVPTRKTVTSLLCFLEKLL